MTGQWPSRTSIQESSFQIRRIPLTQPGAGCSHNSPNSQESTLPGYREVWLCHPPSLPRSLQGNLRCKSDELRNILKVVKTWPT